MSTHLTRVTTATKLTVVSSKHIGSGMAHQLSALDHAMALHTVHVVFYYGENPFGSFALDPMRESLSELLTLYPTVTGRLGRGEDGNWVVKCTDAGLRVTRTKVGATLDEWLRSADSFEERDLAAMDDMPVDPHIWPQFRAQINEFEGGGVAIGVSFTHLNADPTSATLLLKAWADARNGVAIQQPLFTRTSPCDDHELSNIVTDSTKYYAEKFKPATPCPVKNKMASVTFTFTNSMISQYLSEINGDFPDATPFDFLAALFWIRILHVKRRVNEQKHSLSICTDFRKLLQSPSSNSYFGNAVHFSQLSIDSEELDRGGLGHVIGLVHSHLQRLTEEEVWSAMEWLESQREKGGKYSTPLKMYGPELTCVSMEHLVNGNESVMYEAKFMKDVKPAHVSCNVGNCEGEGLIMVMPSNIGKLARNVMVMLPEMEMAELCEDQAILNLHPKLILNGKK